MTRFLKLICLLGIAFVFGTGCAGAGKKVDPEMAKAKLAKFSKQVRNGFDAGKSHDINDEEFVPALESMTLGSSLFHFYAPYAGARMQMDFAERHRAHVLNSIFLVRDENGLFFDFQKDELYQSGNFFRNYELSLFRPVFRQALLQYVQKETWSDQDFERLALALKESTRLTPRQGSAYPNDLSPLTREAFSSYVETYPVGPIADRFRFLALWAERNGAWDKRRGDIDAQLDEILKHTEDELLKIEIKSAINAPRANPQSSFLLSLLVPGLGQISNGDLQGGVILGGLTAAAWVWLISKLVFAADESDKTRRETAYGDAAWAGALVLFGHGFTAYNAHEQARYMNVVVEWDLLNKPRLK